VIDDTMSTPDDEAMVMWSRIADRYPNRDLYLARVATKTRG
jgi:hypothetical protein